MADDLADFPIVVLEADYPETIGKVGLFDYLMFVGPITGITFTAAVPGRLLPWGPVFAPDVQKAANIRAASTLVQMGLISGETYTFMRLALQLSQADLAALYGISVPTIASWENGTVPVPREYWGCLAYRVCLADGRAVPADFAMLPPNYYRDRLIRIFPNIPMRNQPQPDAACPLPIAPCGPPREPVC